MKQTNKQNKNKQEKTNEQTDRQTIMPAPSAS